ncbi:MAG TPA: nucleotidyltransferase domain-containing protein [Kofleriaceae bacterium]|nr:nucleotidyltransferase domain-containing protein [Kofleriaceae bacterium]
MTALHVEAARRAVSRLSTDPRIAGVAAVGSWLGGMDEFSDLDLVIAVHPEHEQAVRAERRAIAETLGPLVACFTGEHVGEPRLLICLYGPPLLHVDLKFVALDDLARRVEEPSILWQRDGALDRALEGTSAHYPQPDPQWIEDRFWIWVHYAALKIGRGELFEAIDFLAYLRAKVLGPLLLARAGHTPNRVRRIEQRVPDSVGALRETVSAHDRADCGRAMKAAVALYRELRADQPITRSQAEAESMRFLDEVLDRV